MKALLEAGVHFGHQTRRWNPKMAPYIYTERNGIYIVDLQKTVRKLEEAYSFVRQLSESGQSLLFVGTKKQAQEAIREEATRCGQFYVNARWLGGKGLHRHGRDGAVREADDRLVRNEHPHQGAYRNPAEEAEKGFCRPGQY